MRILQIFCRYQEKGGEELAVELIGASLRERHDVRELYFDNREFGAAKGLQRLWLPVKFFWNRESGRRFESMRKEFQPDLILVHNLFPAASASVLYKALGGCAPVVYFVHNFRPYSLGGYCWAHGKVEPAGLRLNFWPEIASGAWQNSRIKTAFFGLMLYSMHLFGIWRRIPCWITVSAFMRAQFIAAGIPQRKVHHLSFPWTVALPSSGLAETTEVSVCPLVVNANESEATKPHFLFLGRLSEEKGVAVLLEAWIHYRAAGGEGRLIIGGSGPMAAKVAAHAGPGTAVILVGQISGKVKRQLLRECTAMVVPSVWWEPFGLVVCEAFEMSKPVLAAASGGLTESVRHGENGWLHMPGDSKRLAAHMREVADTPEEATRRGVNGRLWLEGRASGSRWLDAFEGIVTPLLEQKRH